jgi:FkbM family methyltransferase
MSSFLTGLSDSGLVIFGAGNLGKKVAKALCSRNVVPLAFCDNNAALWGSAIAGVPVLSPAEAAKKFPQATFMVAVWHPTRQEGLSYHIRALRSLGCKRVTTFIPVMWEFPETLLPNFFWDLPEKFTAAQADIDAARHLLDDAGREQFDRQLRFRIEGDPFALGDPESSAQYFPSDVFRLSAEECFVDCGAYDGDTLKSFMAESGGQFRRYIALEPEPAIVTRLESVVASDSYLQERVQVHKIAVGLRREVLRFHAAEEGSAISSTGELEIQCVTLDELLKDETPTFIKMDIEGFELDALEGGRQSIQRCRPKLAICAYHRPDHLWRIPLALNELLPGSHLTMRSYMADGRETVCYCIPE